MAEGQISPSPASREGAPDRASLVGGRVWNRPSRRTAGEVRNDEVVFTSACDPVQGPAAKRVDHPRGRSIPAGRGRFRSGHRGATVAALCCARSSFSLSSRSKPRAAAPLVVVAAGCRPVCPAAIRPIASSPEQRPRASWQRRTPPSTRCRCRRRSPSRADAGGIHAPLGEAFRISVRAAPVLAGSDADPLPRRRRRTRARPNSASRLSPVA